MRVCPPTDRSPKRDTQPSTRLKPAATTVSCRFSRHVHTTSVSHLKRWRAPRGPPEACLRARARDERVACSDSRIGWGGCGCKWCLDVAESPRAHSHDQRIESAGEGVAVNSAPMLRSRVCYRAAITHILGEGVAETCIRVLGTTLTPAYECASVRRNRRIRHQTTIVLGMAGSRCL